MLKTLVKQIKQYRKASVLAAAFTVLEVVLELIIPMLMALVIDNGIESGNINNVYFYGLCMIMTAVLGLVCGVLAGRYAAIASAGVASNIRDGMYENIQTFAFSNIDKYSTAGLITRLTTDVTNVQNAYQMIIRMCVRAPISLISALIMALYISAKMGGIFCNAIVFLTVVIAFILWITIPIFSRVFQKYDDLNASVQENVTAIRVVKSYVREDYEKEKFNKAASLIYKLYVKAESRLALNNPAMMTAMYGCTIAISWVGAKMIVSGSLTTGELTSLFSYVTNILISLMLISMIFVMVSMSFASAKRIAEVLDEKPDLKNPDSPTMVVENGNVQFDHVSFSYKKDGNGEKVLDDINIDIKQGEVIGIVGSTGSSKSSLVNLICRLYDVTDGCVKVGDKDVREYDLDILRNEVAVVLQKNQLFSGTILENLRWGKENASLEECMQSCKLAQADEFIQRFPKKYDTYVEQGGANLSGGQKQRLCIARALLKNPKILILDDSTSAVDTATDAKIREAFAKEIPETTQFIIAQRVSSIQNADKIIVMQDGKINGFGNHEELLKYNEIYRSMYESQTKAGGDFDE